MEAIAHDKACVLSREQIESYVRGMSTAEVELYGREPEVALFKRELAGSRNKLTRLAAKIAEADVERDRQ